MPNSNNASSPRARSESTTDTVLPSIDFVLVIKPNTGIGAEADSLALIPSVVVARLFDAARVAQVLDGLELTTTEEAQVFLNSLIYEAGDESVWSVVPFDGEPHYLDQGIWKKPDGFGAQFYLLRDDLSYPTQADGNTFGSNVVGSISVYYPTT